MGPPSFQSECTLAPKKYFLAVAGFTSASHTSALDASIAMDALDTCFLSILSHSPCLTHNVQPISRTRRLHCLVGQHSGSRAQTSSRVSAVSTRLNHTSSSVPWALPLASPLAPEHLRRRR